MLSLPQPSSHISVLVLHGLKEKATAAVPDSLSQTYCLEMAKVLTVHVTSLYKQKQSQDNLSLQLGCLDEIWVSPAVLHFGEP